jgi:hypothetical protein
MSVVLPLHQEDGLDHKHDDRVTSVSIEAEGSLDAEAIDE